MIKDVLLTSLEAAVLTRSAMFSSAPAELHVIISLITTHLSVTRFLVFVEDDAMIEEAIVETRTVEVDASTKPASEELSPELENRLYIT